MAYEIFSLRFLCHADTERHLSLRAFANSSSRKPVKGIFEKTGHDAIITGVLSDHIHIAEQNVCQDCLQDKQSWTRELPLRQKKGKYYITDTFLDTEILGWMIQTEDEHTAFLFLIYSLI